MSGAGVVVLATLGVVDCDGDLVLPGSLANGPNDRVAVSREEHAVILAGEEPVGEAQVYERDGRLWAKVAWGMPNTCEIARERRPTWSVGYRLLKTRPPTLEESRRGAKRVIVKWRIIEISPVREPAGVGTGTLEAVCG